MLFKEAVIKNLLFAETAIFQLNYGVDSTTKDDREKKLWRSFSSAGVSGHEILFDPDNGFSLLLLYCLGNDKRFVGTLVPLKG